MLYTQVNKLPVSTFKWHYGWNVIAMTLVFQSLCVGTHYFCFTLWVIPWSEEFGVARSHIMIAGVCSQIISGLISPMAGRAIDRFPSHILISAGAMLFAGGMLLVSMATALWQIVLVFLVIFPPGLILTSSLPAQTLATRWFTKDRGLALSMSTLGSSVGGLAMPPFAAILLAHAGWRITFVSIGLFIALVVAPLTWLVLKRKPPEEELLDMQHRDNKLPPRPRTFTTGALLRHSDFRTLILCFLPLSLAFNAVQMNLGAYAHDMGVTAQQTGFLVSELSILMLIGRIMIGRMLDRHDHRYLYWMIGGGVSCAIILISVGSSFTALCVGIAILGFFHSGYLPLNSAIVIERFGPRAFGQVLGLSNTFLGMGAVGSLIAASLRDLTGSYALSFLVFLLVLLPAAWQMKKLSAATAAPVPSS
ncbi:MAG: hypothetical protein JWM78_3205 [Verrucomicrobiaceae bacterium]|nr:hypothetical protein [Verrucomicrobiaceae bacterium]